MADLEAIEEQIRMCESGESPLLYQVCKMWLCWGIRWIWDMAWSMGNRFAIWVEQEARARFQRQCHHWMVRAISWFMFLCCFCVMCGYLSPLGILVIFFVPIRAAYNVWLWPYDLDFQEEKRRLNEERKKFIHKLKRLDGKDFLKADTALKTAHKKALDDLEKKCKIFHSKDFKGLCVCGVYNLDDLIQVDVVGEFDRSLQEIFLANGFSFERATEYCLDNESKVINEILENSELILNNTEQLKFGQRVIREETLKNRHAIHEKANGIECKIDHAASALSQGQDDLLRGQSDIKENQAQIQKSACEERRKIMRNQQHLWKSVRDGHGNIQQRQLQLQKSIRQDNKKILQNQLQLQKSTQDVNTNILQNQLQVQKSVRYANTEIKASTASAFSAVSKKIIHNHNEQQSALQTVADQNKKIHEKIDDFPPANAYNFVNLEMNGVKTEIKKDCSEYNFVNGEANGLGKLEGKFGTLENNLVNVLKKNVLCRLKDQRMVH